MTGEDYDLIPHRVVSDLKKDIEDMKKNPLGGTSSGKDLINSIEDLNSNLTMMTDLFKEASESLKLEEKEEEVLSKKIDPMIEKLDMIVDQNKKIAQGIVAVADMINDKLAQIAEMQRPAQPQQQQSQPNNSMNPSGMNPMMGQDIPEFGQQFGGKPPMQPAMQPNMGMQMPSMPSGMGQGMGAPQGMPQMGRGIEGTTGMNPSVPQNLPPLGNAEPFPSFGVPEKPKKKPGMGFFGK